MAPPSASPGARLGRAAAALWHSQRPRPSAPPGAGMARALGRGGRHLLRRWGRILASVGLQVAALLYLALALAFGGAGVKGWLAYRHSTHLRAASLTQAPGLVQLELALALIFLYFALSSLVRAGRSA